MLIIAWVRFADFAFSILTGDELFFVEPGIHSVRYEAVVEGADGGRIGVGAPLRSTLGEALS